MDLLQGHNWWVGRVGWAIAHLDFGRKVGHARQCWTVASLVAHPAFGSYFRPCVSIPLAVSGEKSPLSPYVPLCLDLVHEMEI